MPNRGTIASRGSVVGARLIAAAALIALCPGCNQVLVGLTGKPPGSGAQTGAAAPPQAPVTTAFLSDSTLTPGFGGQAVLPPTLPMDGPEGDAGPEPTTSAGPHKPIAVAPLSSDASALSSLAAAVNRAPATRDSRFVLLVLTPPAADADALQRKSGEARLAAAAAVRVMGDAGVVPDRVEVSMATNPDAGDGEMRLYMR
jgi:hypothetical protein